MKNIHVLPTDKKTRLFTSDSVLILAGYPATTFKTGKNIFITSDEEIKEGDWLIVNDEDVMQMKSSYDNDMSGEDIWVGDSLNGYATYKDNCKKIILTTDQDLINLGVQAIDDEFLEWFVKNPSCEEVEVILNEVSYFIEDNIYKIIIPKEEPLSYEEFRKIASNDLNNKFDTDCSKYSEDGDSDNFFYANCKYWESKIKEEQKQHLIDMMKTDEELGLYEEPKQTDENGKPLTYWGGLAKPKQENCCTPIGQIKRYIDCKGCSKKPKQETTPEEVAEYLGFVKGVKWQMERSYSEEEVLELLLKMNEWSTTFDGEEDVKEWFEQFKKK